jgi:hypothetical protein
MTTNNHNRTIATVARLCTDHTHPRQAGIGSVATDTATVEELP